MPSHSGRIATSVVTSADSEQMTNHEALDLYRQALQDMVNEDWDTVMEGLANVIHVLKQAPYHVSEGDQMPFLMRTVTSLVRSLRSKVSIAACRTAYALFKRVDCTRRPDFDQLVGSLLVRTGDMNRFLREESIRSLAAMAEYIPTLNAVRALVEQGGRNKNDLVRAATAKTLNVIVESHGAAALIEKKEIREKLYPTLASLLEDAHPETRAYAKNIFAMLSKDQKFYGYFRALVRPNQMTRLEKLVGSLR